MALAERAAAVAAAAHTTLAVDAAARGGERVGKTSRRNCFSMKIAASLGPEGDFKLTIFQWEGETSQFILKSRVAFLSSANRSIDLSFRKGVCAA